MRDRAPNFGKVSKSYIQFNGRLHIESDMNITKP
jgi:hypothetical protein